MMRVYSKNASSIRFAAPGTKISVLGVLILILAGMSEMLKLLFLNIPAKYLEDVTLIESMGNAFGVVGKVLSVLGILLIIVGLICNKRMSDSTRIRLMVERGLFCYSYGNPLHFKEQEKLPKVSCKDIGLGRYALEITVISAPIEDIENLTSSISSCLNDKFNQYAVVQTSADLGYNVVNFQIEDVTVDRSLVVHSAKELKADSPTLIPVQKGTCIDLTTSGSILVSGKTRSGKTTGIISVLIAALNWGRDDHGSEIIIIDPKQAELSRLPHTITLDDNGEAREILNVMRKYCDTIKKGKMFLMNCQKKGGTLSNGGRLIFTRPFYLLMSMLRAGACFPKELQKKMPNTTFRNLIISLSV